MRVLGDYQVLRILSVRQGIILTVRPALEGDHYLMQTTPIDEGIKVEAHGRGLSRLQLIAPWYISREWSTGAHASSSSVIGQRTPWIQLIYLV